MQKLLIITAISFLTLLVSTTSYSQNLKYKGYAEVNYSLGMGRPEVYSGIKIEPAEMGLISTSHGIVLSEKLFIGAGGAYQKHLTQVVMEQFPFMQI